MIILRRVPYGDSSLVLHLFTQNAGRRAAIAKGAFREKSPFQGSLDLLNEISATLAGRHAEGLRILSNVTVADDHRGFRRELFRIVPAMFACELIETATTEAPSPELYHSFAALLRDLDACAAAGVALARLNQFEFEFLIHAGIQPRLDACARCEGALVAGPRGIATSASAGGGLCQTCARRESGVFHLSEGALAAARAAAGGGCGGIENRVARELRGFLDRFHVYHLDRHPRSRPSLELLYREPVHG